MRVVIALGGNALLRRGEPMDVEIQVCNARRAATAVAAVAAEHDVVITHGNGPQVGLLALQAEAYTEGPILPLDLLGAESEGLIGYLLDRELVGLLPHRRIATVLTQTLVSTEDPALDAPSKPIGPVYPPERGAQLAAERGWVMRPDGDGLRRVVPSPAPAGIVELPTLRLLLEHQVLVICAGGGGVPVARRPDGRLQGVEAVVDKDAASALLARELDADALLLLTDVDAVYRGWPGRGDPVREISADHLEALPLAAGSMGPKAAAACAFARSGGAAAIGALDDALAVLEGRAGTRISRI
ncbi:MAG TPA: carbamate kinase [Deltaproteobacteria bacterium]|nr:carbamate kinase [Deltaproteobacteria bacterium]